MDPSCFRHFMPDTFFYIFNKFKRKRSGRCLSVPDSADVDSAEVPEVELAPAVELVRVQEVGRGGGVVVAGPQVREVGVPVLE